MKVKELILELQKYDPELMVCTSGYEDGITESDQVKLFEKKSINELEPWYYGEIVDSKDGSGFSIVYISGKRH